MDETIQFACPKCDVPSAADAPRCGACGLVLIDPSPTELDRQLYFMMLGRWRVVLLQTQEAEDFSEGEFELHRGGRARIRFREGQNEWLETSARWSIEGSRLRLKIARVWVEGESTSFMVLIGALFIGSMADRVLVLERYLRVLEPGQVTWSRNFGQRPSALLINTTAVARLGETAVNGAPTLALRLRHSEIDRDACLEFARAMSEASEGRVTIVPEPIADGGDEALELVAVTSASASSEELRVHWERARAWRAHGLLPLWLDAGAPKQLWASTLCIKRDDVDSEAALRRELLPHAELDLRPRQSVFFKAELAGCLQHASPEPAFTLTEPPWALLGLLPATIYALLALRSLADADWAVSLLATATSLHLAHALASLWSPRETVRLGADEFVVGGIFTQRSWDTASISHFRHENGVVILVWRDEGAIPKMAETAIQLFAPLHADFICQALNGQLQHLRPSYSRYVVNGVLDNQDLRRERLRHVRARARERVADSFIATWLGSTRSTVAAIITDGRASAREATLAQACLHSLIRGVAVTTTALASLTLFIGVHTLWSTAKAVVRQFQFGDEGTHRAYPGVMFALWTLTLPLNVPLLFKRIALARARRRGDAASEPDRDPIVAEPEARMFLSYCRKDENFALDLTAKLQELGVDVWLDRINLELGQDWQRGVREGLEHRSCLALILSGKSLASDAVGAELATAAELWGDALRVVNIVIDDTVLPDTLAHFVTINLRALGPELDPDHDLCGGDALRTPLFSRQKPALDLDYVTTALLALREQAVLAATLRARVERERTIASSGLLAGVKIGDTVAGDRELLGPAGHRWHLYTRSRARLRETIPLALGWTAFGLAWEHQRASLIGSETGAGGEVLMTTPVLTYSALALGLWMSLASARWIWRQILPKPWCIVKERLVVFPDRDRALLTDDLAYFEDTEAGLRVKYFAHASVEDVELPLDSEHGPPREVAAILNGLLRLSRGQPVPTSQTSRDTLPPFTRTRIAWWRERLEDRYGDPLLELRWEHEGDDIAALRSLVRSERQALLAGLSKEDRRRILTTSLRLLAFGLVLVLTPGTWAGLRAGLSLIFYVGCPALLLSALKWLFGPSDDDHPFPWVVGAAIVLVLVGGCVELIRDALKDSPSAESEWCRGPSVDRPLPPEDPSTRGSLQVHDRGVEARLHDDRSQQSASFERESGPGEVIALLGAPTAVRADSRTDRVELYYFEDGLYWSFEDHELSSLHVYLDGGRGPSVESVDWCRPPWTRAHYFRAGRWDVASVGDVRQAHPEKARTLPSPQLIASLPVDYAVPASPVVAVAASVDVWALVPDQVFELSTCNPPLPGWLTARCPGVRLEAGAAGRTLRVDFRER